MHRSLPLSVCLFALVAAPAAAAPPAEDCNLRLTLIGGYAVDGRRADVTFELPIRGGQWPDRFDGYAAWFSRGHQVATLKEHRAEVGEDVLVLDVEVVGDHWVRGGTAAYTVTLTPDGTGGYTGAYEGTFEQDGSARLNFPMPGQPPQPTGPKTDDQPDKRPGGDAPKPAPADGLLELMGGNGQKGGAEDDATSPAPPPGGTGAAVRGEATAVVAPVWPGLVAGHQPVAGTEHPRLIFRKADVPRFRKLAETTDEGKAILAAAERALGRRGPSEGDKFTTWPAVGYGFMYQMTGEQRYAEAAKNIVVETVFDNRAGRRGWAISQDIHHGPRLQGLALAFDLCHDGWDQAFRQRCVDEISQRVDELAVGVFGGKRMSGYNPNPWSNHNGIRAGCAALGALAIHGHTTSDGEKLDMSRHAELLARELKLYYETGLGGSGHPMEGGFYKTMTMERGLTHAVLAYRVALGWDVVAGPVADFDMTGYFMEAAPGSTPSLKPILWAAGMVTVPDAWLPAIKTFHTRKVGLKGDRSFGIAHGLLAPYAMATYPFDVEAAPPGGVLPWIAPDPELGHFIVRPRWEDGDDPLLVTNFKSGLKRGCHYERAGPQSHVELQAFGRQWLNGMWAARADMLPGKDGIGNAFHGPKPVRYVQDDAARTAVIDFDASRMYLVEAGKGQDAERIADSRGLAGAVRLPEWGAGFLDYGIRATRHMAVDCSGKPGGPMLIAVVDRVQVPEGKTTWPLPVKGGKVEADGRRFTVGGAADGPGLSGVLVTPGGFGKGLTASSDAGDYFVVMVLHDGPAPPIAVEGEGLDATVTVGERSVRFDGQSLVLE